MLHSFKVLARLTLVVATALAPTLAARQPRGPFPRRAREAGRDEALYRRLKWRQVIGAGRVILDRQGRSVC